MDNVWARFFPIFLEKDLLKVDKILGLTFFRQEKTSKDSKRRFSIYCCWVLWSMDCLQVPFIRLEEAVWWTQRFLTWKIWPKNEVYLWQINLKANVCRNSTFQVNTRKNATWHTSHFFTEKNQVAREILRWYASRKHCITRLYIGKRYRVPNPCFTRIAMWPDNTSSWRQLGGIRGPLFSVA